MRPASRAVLLVMFLLLLPCVHAQSPADLATLNDLKTASKQMHLESEGVPSFRLEATYATFDFMGRPENEGHWLEEFANVHASRTTVRDGGSPENYAPEDQANIGVPVAGATHTFMQNFLIDAFLRPGPSDVFLANSKSTIKSQKIGNVSLRCVILEPKDKAKSSYLERAATRVYCLSADAPIIRTAQLEYGIVVTYNSLARFGGRMIAQQVTAQQRGHERGKLQVTKLTAAPELLQANLPKVEADGPPAVASVLKRGTEVTAGSILSKVQPVYPMDSKMKHISGSVILHAIINKEGAIDSLEVISAPADDMAESAIEAVSQWRYKPYLLNGAPTEVDTTITVNYSIG